MTITIGEWISGEAVSAPKALSRRLSSSLSPVTRVQAGLPENCAAQDRSRSGVSVAGSTETEIKKMSRPKCSPRLLRNFPNVPSTKGQILVDVLEGKFI